MARKSIATLLVALWVVLSAVELLRHADLGTRSAAYSARGSAAADLGCSGRVINNALENRSPQLVGAELSIVASPARRNGRFQICHGTTKGAHKTDPPEKNRKIYKLHGAFRI